MAVKKGDKAVVLSDQLSRPATGVPLTSFAFPSTVTLPEAVTTSITSTLKLGTRSSRMYIQPTSVNISVHGNVYIEAYYYSEDGVTYLLDYCSIDGPEGSVNEGDVECELGTTLTITGSVLGTYFFQSRSVNFNGLFVANEIINGAQLLDYKDEWFTLPYDIIETDQSGVMASMFKNSGFAGVYDTETHHIYLHTMNRVHVDEEKGEVWIIANSSGDTNLSMYDFNPDSGTTTSTTYMVPALQGYQIADLSKDIFFYQNCLFYEDHIGYFGDIPIKEDTITTKPGRKCMSQVKQIWEPQAIGIKTTPDKILKGNKAFTDAGVIEGSFGTELTIDYIKNLTALFNALDSTPAAGSLSGLFSVSSGSLSTALVPYMNVTGVSNLSSLFNQRNDIAALNLEHWDVSSCVDLSSTFFGKFQELHISNWDVQKVQYLQHAFRNVQCSTLDLSGWYCPELQNAYAMFYGASINTLDMRNFDFTVLTNKNQYGEMFSGGFKTNCLIIVKDEAQKNWITTNFTTLTNVKTVAEYTAN